jgi:hypothetical protein
MLAGAPEPAAADDAGAAAEDAGAAAEDAGAAAEVAGAAADVVGAADDAAGAAFFELLHAAANVTSATANVTALRRRAREPWIILISSVVGVVGLLNRFTRLAGIFGAIVHRSATCEVRLVLVLAAGCRRHWGG